MQIPFDEAFVLLKYELLVQEESSFFLLLIQLNPLVLDVWRRQQLAQFSDIQRWERLRNNMLHMLAGICEILGVTLDIYWNKFVTFSQINKIPSCFQTIQQRINSNQMEYQITLAGIIKTFVSVLHFALQWMSERLEQEHFRIRHKRRRIIIESIILRLLLAQHPCKSKVHPRLKITFKISNQRL